MKVVHAFTADPSLDALFREQPGYRREGGLPGVPATWRDRSNRYGFRATAKIFGILCGLLALTPWAVRYVSVASVVVLAPLIGAYIYKLTIVMHDCGHKTLFSDDRYNRLVGHLCAAFLGSNFRRFTYEHMIHHRYNGTPRDRQVADIVAMRHASRWERIWYLLKPLTGEALFSVVGLYLRPDRGPRTAIVRATPKGGGRRIGMVGPLAAIAAVQLAIVALATGLGRVWWLAAMYPVCAVTFGLFFSRLRGFCEHIPPSPSQETFTRTHRPNWFDGIFFYDIGMNYHVEHHLFPSMPSCNLDRVYTLLSRGYHTADTASPSIARTLLRTVARAR